MRSAKFDQFSNDYSTLVDQSVAISGENSGYFSEYKARYIAKLRGENFAGRVLDYGCGIGLLSGFLHHHLVKARIDGFDISADSVARVSPELKDQGLYSNDPSLFHCVYDLAVVANVIHHVPLAERLRVVSMVAACLVRGGMIVLFEHNPLNPLTRWAVKHCPFDDDAVLLKPKEAIGYLEASRLRIQLRDYILFFPRVLSALRPLEPALRWLPAGAQYVVVAEKPPFDTGKSPETQ